jgi:hypothetical protein
LCAPEKRSEHSKISFIAKVLNLVMLISQSILNSRSLFLILLSFSYFGLSFSYISLSFAYFDLVSGLYILIFKWVCWGNRANFRGAELNIFRAATTILLVRLPKTINVR